MPVLHENINVENIAHHNESLLTELADRINSENKDGRVIIRPSGTEPVIRISIEHKDQKTAESILETIRKDIVGNG